MDTGTAAVIIAGLSVAMTLGYQIFGGGWKVSSKLTSLETTSVETKAQLAGIQAEMKEIGKVLIKLADMRGDFRVLDIRVTAIEQQVATSAKHIDDLRKGIGYIRDPNRQGIDGEYP